LDGHNLDGSLDIEEVNFVVGPSGKKLHEKDSFCAVVWLAGCHSPMEREFRPIFALPHRFMLAGRNDARSDTEARLPTGGSTVNLQLADG
jgi:hypothetical protein